MLVLAGVLYDDMIFLIYLLNSKDVGMTIMARQPIKKGEAIYHSYARELTTTTFRRLILFSGILIDLNIT